MAENGQEEVKNENQEGMPAETPEVTDDISLVASSRKKGIAIGAGIGIAFLVLLYNLYNGYKADEEAKKVVVEKVKQPEIVNAPPSLTAEDLKNNNKVELPKIAGTDKPDAPPPPPVVPSTPLVPDPSSAGQDSNSALPSVPGQSDSGSVAGDSKAPSMPGMPNAPVASSSSALSGPRSNAAIPAAPGEGGVIASLLQEEDPEAQALQAKRKEAKRKSSITLIGGTESQSPAAIEQSQDFIKRGDAQYLLGRGKVIDAILETAINTNFTGEVRAVVIKDVYSDSGKVVLIPKGSRVFGSYTTVVDQNYGKIDIMWNRIDLPTGYSVNIAAPSIDHLGRPGVIGRLDNKHTEKLGGVVLATALNVVSGNLIDKLVPPPSNASVSAANTEMTNNIRTVTNQATADSTKDAATKITAICTQLPPLITDKTSGAYTQIQTACTTAQTAPPDATGKKDYALQNLLLTLSSVSDSLAQATANASTPSKAQEAAKQGFEELSNALKETINNQMPAPNITVDQGKAVKIYVNKDYNFPKAAVSKSTIVR